MKITNLKFSQTDAAAIYALAGAACKDQGMSRKDALSYIAALTPQNVLRLALGLPVRRRGGARPNSGRKRGEPHA
jgi:hypothetical protein